MESIFNFNHESEKINEALGVTDALDAKCTNIILFSTAANYYIVEDLYESRDEAPKNLKTLSGDLNKALTLCQTEEEKNYTLFIFDRTHKLVKEVIERFIDKNKGTEADTIKLEILSKLLDLRIAEEIKKRDIDGDDYKGLLGVISPSNLIKNVKLVKKSNYNFDKYMALVNDEQ